MGTKLLLNYLNYDYIGVVPQMITILRRVVWQMITVYHESWVVPLGISFPKT